MSAKSNFKRLFTDLPSLAKPLVTVVTAGIMSAVLPLDATHAGPLPKAVDAEYGIYFNGFDVGTFVFRARTNGQRYSLTGDANLSAIFGILKWQSQIRSSGRFTRGKARPNSYDFQYVSNDKRGSLAIKFQRGAVESVAVYPPVRISQGHVPLTRSHLKCVLDPMSALLALSIAPRGKAAVANPCQGRIPIFDGRQRFDLKLSRKRRIQINNRPSRGVANYAFICKVKYIPIAGYKKDRNTSHMSSTDDMEIWLAPAPEANAFVPLQIRIPTIAGTASLISKQIRISTSSGAQLALLQ